MKTSLVVTVLNEAKQIQELLDSVDAQTRKINEIVLVDAGSTDDTVEIIKHWVGEKKDSNAKIIEAKDVNRSEGRNAGIFEATNNLILLTDAGCRLDKDWTKNLTNCFESQTDVDVVAGFYDPEIESDWMEVFSWYTCTLDENFETSSFIPSARSVALTKDAWSRYGGFPEHLDTCEDLVFFEEVHRMGMMRTCKKALVYWRQKERLSEFFSQIAGYAKGDVQAMHTRHGVRIVGVYMRYMLFGFFPYLLLLYPLFPLWKFRTKIVGWRNGVRLIVTQFVADLAVMWGGVLGLFANLRSS